MIKSFIPNFLTLLNLICGCFSIAFAFQFQFDAVLILVLMGVLLDFLDGIAARLLNTESNFGKQLDSLSDIVTSGVVPGIVVYQLFKLSGNRVLDLANLTAEPNVIRKAINATGEIENTRSKLNIGFIYEFKSKSKTLLPDNLNN